jgi:hypothetical protein
MIPKIIVAGGREFSDYQLLSSVLSELGEFILVCGMARGADLLGHRFATEHDFLILEYPADWDRFGKSAGHRRNAEMGKNADALVAFWDGKSPGTRHMINIMKTLGKPYEIITY